MPNKVKVAIAGLGGRGRTVYADMLHGLLDQCEVVALAEPNEEAMSLVKEDFGVEESMCFATCEELLEQEKMADVLFICTQDEQHVSQAVAALERGYHLLLEKPIATSVEDCKRIQDAAHKSGKSVVVCHVLRYTPFFSKIKEIIESGVIGDIITVNAIEHVCYWHQAHSFVRGNWRNSKEACPMIVAKCCHDMDILRWLIDKKVKKVSSFGELTHFTAANAPKGAAMRCKDCPDDVRKDCKFDAYAFYPTRFTDSMTGEPRELGEWPADILAPVPTWDNCKAALDNGPYGRCVYHCDNDVVDHQVVNLLFEDDVTCNFTMTAFTHNESRGITIMGTRGEIRADNHKKQDNIIHVYEFGKDEVTYDINKMSADLSGHGGGDRKMLEDFIGALYRGEKPIFDIDMSMDSHYIAFAAEQSRKNGGQVIDL